MEDSIGYMILSLSNDNEGVKFMFSIGHKTEGVQFYIPQGVSDGQWHHVEAQYYYW